MRPIDQQNGNSSVPQTDQSQSSQARGQNNSGNQSNSSSGNSEERQGFQPPVINLPKGGGAIQGIGEKFQANPVTGTGSMSVPIAMSPGRGGFTPQLALSYDSGAGNSPFGLGWNVGLPSISRKTSKGLPEYGGLPKYYDADESDVFLLSGAEDLVPVLNINGEVEPIKINDDSGNHKYNVYRYIPRIEGLFARIEKWLNINDKSSYWKSITKENITTIYGESDNAKIVDPKDSWKVFQWKIEKTFDDKGNVIFYEYKKENGEGFPPKPIFEKNRNADNAYNQTYLKRVLYGNTIPYQNDGFDKNQWLFELVFDYGEHTTESDDAPSYDEIDEWSIRPDIFSSFRSGFDIRTYRLCRQILMFHHFENELGIPNYLVKSTHWEFDDDPILTKVESIIHTGYRFDSDSGKYVSKSFPPVSFKYTEQKIDPKIYEIHSADLPNAPQGIDGQQYQFNDLYGEGLNGILSQRGGAWYYKRNEGDGSFGAQQLVAEIPSLAINAKVQVADFGGNGLTDVVIQNGNLNGFYELSEEAEWSNFKPFQHPVNFDLNDPSMRMLDLDGNGIPDILITENDCFVWYPSDAKDGYKAARRVAKVLDEEQGPRIVFNESFQTVFLSDMSGDGLTDIVRVRNGEICYWANMGYGRFSHKITMADAPHFDYPDYFDPSRIRFADIDGSGSVDVLYLGRYEIRYWLNQSGNSWSAPKVISNFPKTSNIHSVSVFDLLGNGTSCIVWSSPLPAEANTPMKCIKLMGDTNVEGNKPYLLKEVNNNMGAITRMKYEASTKFYLEDRRKGNPWITKLPFPVQVLVRQEVFDEIAGNHFVSRSAYHHGYFDKTEREFRGFGMVEQWDTEDYETLSQNTLFEVIGQNWSEEIDIMPPIYTKTWFHNGYYKQGGKITKQYEHEYYPKDTDEWKLPDTDLPEDLTPFERREAARAIKGRPLRVEVYAADGSAEAENPYTVTETKYHVKTIQKKEENRHASFYVCECETLSFQYERNPADPRIAHQHTLEIDEYGNVQKTAAVVYPRRIATPHAEQKQMYVTYNEADFINKDDVAEFYRIGVPYQQRVFEINGLTVPIENSEERPFLKEELKTAIAGATEISFEEEPTSGIQKRLVNFSKSTFYSEDLLSQLTLGEIASHALPYQTYEAVYTDGVIDKFIKDGDALITKAQIISEGKFIEDGDYLWRTSGRAIFDESHFYLPIKQLDPFGHEYFTEYDAYDLAMLKTKTSIHGKDIVSEGQMNYRILQPDLLTDPNGNQSEVIFDELGMVIATAIKGKNGEGDTLDGYASIEMQEVDLRDVIIPNYKTFLQTATSFFHYDLYAWQRERKPNHAMSVVRETHVSEEKGIASEVQFNFSYSDGFGQMIMVKVQAESGDAFLIENDVLINDFADTRWVGNGRTVFNNKGNPVKQYEPYFSHSFDYESETELVEYGVSPILHYDSLGRNVRTDLPDGTFTKVEFTPWEQKTFDQNDTVLESDWKNLQNASGNVYKQRAVTLAAAHAETPKIEHLDTLGRVFLMQDDNGVDGIYDTHFKLDILGNQVEVTDAKGRLITRNHFNMAKEPIRTESMDAGLRWSLTNVMGNPLYGWNDRDFQTRMEYDALQRNTATFVTDAAGNEKLVYFNVYGEQLTNPAIDNHFGQLYQLYDQAGCKTTERIDFKGNPLDGKQQVCREYKDVIDWSVLYSKTNVNAIQSAANSLLENEVFTTSSEVDALNRPIKTIAPDGSETFYTYNEANFLEKIQTRLNGAGTLTDFVRNIDYDAKGQRTRIYYGNEVTTTYEYDEKTFRLTRLRSTRNGGAEVLQDLQYYYDPVGNITDMRDDAQQTIFFQNTVVEPHSSYTYDALYRLIKAEGREHIGQTSVPEPKQNPVPHAGLPHANNGQAMRRYTRNYVYDELGNILSVSNVGGWTRKYKYEEDSLIANATDKSNHLTATTTDDWMTSSDYVHDIHGNMTHMPHLPEMIWDFADQLKEVELPQGNEYYTYTIGGGKDFGVRTRKVTEQGGLIKDRIYIGDYEVYRERKAGNINTERTTLHLQDDKGRIALVDTLTIENPLTPQPPSIIRYQLSNHLGSATLEVDDNADMISYEEYYPFGASSYRAGRSAAEVSLKRYRYVGKERDENTGLDYYGARYYVSWLGRWIKADPAGFIDGPNLFSYVKNNPIKLIDPTGLSGESGQHTIKENDTYWDLAQDSSGAFTVNDLKEWNPGVDWNNLKIGSIINISAPESNTQFDSYSNEGLTLSPLQPEALNFDTLNALGNQILYFGSYKAKGTAGAKLIWGFEVDHDGAGAAANIYIGVESSLTVEGNTDTILVAPDWGGVASPAGWEVAKVYAGATLEGYSDFVSTGYNYQIEGIFTQDGKFESKQVINYFFEWGTKTEQFRGKGENNTKVNKKTNQVKIETRFYGDFKRILIQYKFSGGEEFVFRSPTIPGLKLVLYGQSSIEGKFVIEIPNEDEGPLIIPKDLENNFPLSFPSQN